jgi:hypothetical protein
VPTVVGLPLRPGDDVWGRRSHLLVTAGTAIGLPARTAHVPDDVTVLDVLTHRRPEDVVVTGLQRG